MCSVTQQLNGYICGEVFVLICNVSIAAIKINNLLIHRAQIVNARNCIAVQSPGHLQFESTWSHILHCTLEFFL